TVARQALAARGQVRGQRLGDRLPADRRGGPMSAAVAAARWLIGAVAVVAAVVTRHALSGRMELVARACHELRGPITAARLGLALGERAWTLSPEQLRGVALELGRASLALGDLAAVEGAAGRRSPVRAPS